MVVSLCNSYWRDISLRGKPPTVWLPDTWYESNGSGGGVILPERECADRRRNQNRNDFINRSFASSRKTAHDLEMQHEDDGDEYAARKSLNEWFNNDVVRFKLTEVPRKEYKLLVKKRERGRDVGPRSEGRGKKDLDEIGMEMMRMAGNMGQGRRQGG